MSDKVIFATNVDTGEPVGIEVEDLIEHRAQCLAGSGAGKSHLLRSLCEKGYGKFQQIIIGPKIEFVTLKEKFDYLHIGKSSEVHKADIELNTRYAGQLALKLLETGTNSVIEFSQAPLERVKYVRNFVESLMSSPMHLWHPVMILIDEIDIWAPEKGHGEAESLNAIADLAARGRDKGFFLVAATQNLAKFNKDVASELDIKLVGKVTLDVHQTRAANELGIPLKEKGQLRLLGKPNYHFYAFGPGLSDEIIKIKSMPITTSHISGYKRNKNLKPIPTSAKMQQIISNFADLPQEAEKELKTKDDMQKHIKELTVRLHQLEKQQPKPIPVDPLATQKAEQLGYQKGIKEAEIQFAKFQSGLKRLYATHKPIYKRIAEMATEIAKVEQIIPEIDQFVNTPLSLKLPALPTETKLPIVAKSVDAIFVTPPHPLTVAKDKAVIAILEGEVKLSPYERKILTAVVQRQDKPGSRKLIAVMCGYSIKSSSFKNALGKIRSNGLIEYQGDILIPTQKGITEIGDYEELPTDNESLLRLMGNVLAPYEHKILSKVCENRDGISREDLAAACEYSPTSSSFKNALGKLRSMGLIDYKSNIIIPTEEMFPE